MDNKITFRLKKEDKRLYCLDVFFEQATVFIVLSSISLGISLLLLLAWILKPTDQTIRDGTTGYFLIFLIVQK